MRPLFCLSLFLYLSVNAQASGIRGYLKGDDGNVLSYATIYVKQTGSGTTTNEQGYYEISLKAGTYDFIFQYVGYESVERKITIEDGFIDLNLTLKTQVIQLR
ncbi:MAG: carboxypeptidase-like regulatory domain-containing protein, partial [Flammeovirgaceae bacterium]|nr:carboxypeptidase-like regulatory domain-containing protein [Flammeovirgaceae bacterium]